MSFGVGVADIIQALHFVKVTYDSWKDAPERYQAIKQRLHALRGPLKRLAGHYAGSHRRMSRSSQRDLDNILFCIENTLEHLDRIIAKRSDLKFWDRLRLNSHEISDLSGALDRHVQDLTCLCTSLGLENSRQLRHGQEILQHGQHDLKQGQDELLRLVSQLLPPKVPVETVEAVAQSVDSFGMSLSFVTDYSDEDDPAVWRDFRRKAIAEGVTSRDLETYEAPLHDLLRSLGTRRHKDRCPALHRPTISFDETVQLPSRRSRSSRRHDDRSFLFPNFDDLPSRFHDRSQSRARVSREPARPLFVDDLRDARSSSLEDEGDYIRHISRERSRHRRRRGHSLSVESESRSEVTLVIRPRSVERRR
ncbi:hypothetical protein Q7P35_001514 [Cladosporium inversicolor]